MTTLLGHDAVRHIVGQRETTLDFAKIMAERQIVLVKLPATLAPDIKKFIGTILISELLHAVRNRPEDKRNQFCIFVDEFQHFVNYEDFGILITEARKYGIATTIVHQERFGQLGDNKQIIGATDATVNKVFFRLSVRDAKEQAPEFAREPTTTETRLEPELIITKQPVWELLHRGHANPRVQELAGWYLGRLQKQIHDCKELMDEVRLERMDLQDQAAIFRDKASLAGVDARREGITASLTRGRDIPISHQGLDDMQAAFEQGLSLHNLTWEQAFAIKEYYKMW